MITVWKLLYNFAIYGSRNHNFKRIPVSWWLKTNFWEKRHPNSGLEVSTKRNMTHRNYIKVLFKKMRGMASIQIYTMYVLGRIFWLRLIQSLRFLLYKLEHLSFKCILSLLLVPWSKHSSLHSMYLGISFLSSFC